MSFWPSFAVYVLLEADMRDGLDVDGILPSGSLKVLLTVTVLKRLRHQYS